MTVDANQLLALLGSAIVSLATGAVSLLSYVRKRETEIIATVRADMQPQIDKLSERIARLESAHAEAVDHLTPALEITARIPEASEATRYIRQAIGVLR